jgi:hypothetical protein
MEYKMKKFNVSKVVYFLVLIFGLCYLSGCVPPQVVSTIPNEITSTHCIFEYNGNLDDIYSKLKREVAGYNFVEFQPDDRNSALLVTNFKSLSIDEKYNINLFFTTPPSKVHMNKQDGRLVFIFTEMGDKIQIEFYTITEVMISGTSKEPANIPARVPHPILLKYKEIIREMPNMKLISD